MNSLQDKIDLFNIELAQLNEYKIELTNNQDEHFRIMGYSKSMISSIRDDVEGKYAVLSRLISQKELQIKKYKELVRENTENQTS